MHKLFLAANNVVLLGINGKDASAMEMPIKLVRILFMRHQLMDFRFFMATKRNGLTLSCLQWMSERLKY